MQSHLMVQEAVSFILERQQSPRPRVGIILGTGLGGCAEILRDRRGIPLRDIPHFPIPLVPGHKGSLVFGTAGGIPAAAIQGRTHFYEGLSMSEVTYGVRVLGCLGIGMMVVTNAAGGIHKDFRPGDLMLITDHINLMGTNPLIGREPGPGEERFPDMSEAYDLDLRREILQVAAERGIALRHGVYAGVTGPCFETPAEIRMCRTLGADAIGMSTVPEVIVARQMGIPVLGVSCISNMAADSHSRGFGHREVLETSRKTAAVLGDLLSAAIPRLAKLIDTPAGS